MNVVSTATVLPCTVGEINSVLTIVFVGQKKFDPKKLGNFLQVCMNKIWTFLLFLKENNKLYNEIMINQSSLNEYPENNSLSRIQHWVIDDKLFNAMTLFEEETAGVSSYPASSSLGDIDQRDFMIERMGLSDPESS